MEGWREGMGGAASLAVTEEEDARREEKGVVSSEVGKKGNNRTGKDKGCVTSGKGG